MKRHGAVTKEDQRSLAGAGGGGVVGGEWGKGGEHVYFPEKKWVPENLSQANENDTHNRGRNTPLQCRTSFFLALRFTSTKAFPLDAPFGHSKC